MSRQKGSEEVLAEDLQLEILCRIPYKSLMQFKCVSKRWLFLISNPDPIFVSRYPFHSWTHMYFSTNEKKLKPVYKDSDPRFEFEGFSLSFLPCYQPKETESIHIYSILNDLFLCSSTADSAKTVNPIVYYVCNPLTKHWVALPPTPTPNNDKYVIAKLICDESERFKVVRVHCYLRGTGVLRLEIFSFGTAAARWICRKVVLNRGFFLNLARNVEICNGTLYVDWGRDEDISEVDFNSLINNHSDSDNASFASANHHHLIRLPNVRHATRPGFQIIACRGRLRAVEVAFPRREFPVLYIWELKENNHHSSSNSVRGGEDAWNLLHCDPFSEFIALSNRQHLSKFRKWFYDLAHGRFPLRNSYQHRVHHFNPVDGNTVYLDLHDRFVSYDTCYKFLIFHHQFKSVYGKTKPIFQVALPLRPTPVPC